MGDYKTKIIVGKEGRITVPNGIRKILGIEEGDVLEFDLKDGKLEVKVIN